MEMIDPKSLRIGNYVRNTNWIWSTDETNIVKEIYGAHVVTEIKSPSVTEFSASKRAEISHISGIPLSEQELIRLGFENGGYDLLFWSKSHGVQLVEISGFEGSFGIRVNDQVDVTLEYVHDLQNWWQMLTKTELTYKVENETIKP